MEVLLCKKKIPNLFALALDKETAIALYLCRLVEQGAHMRSPGLGLEFVVIYKSSVL